MKYDFSLTSKTLMMLIAGITVAAALIFFVGVFVGMGLGVPAGEVQMARRMGGSPNGPPAPLAPPVARIATAVSAPPTAANEPKSMPAAPESKQEVSTAPSESESGSVKGFALQVGAFRDAKNAKTLLDDLKDRGYSATLFNSVDSRQRYWHAVRIIPRDQPAFADLSAASRAAVDFTNKEQIQAFVRPVDSL